MALSSASTKTCIAASVAAALVGVLGFFSGFFLHDPLTGERCNPDLTLIRSELACNKRYVIDKREFTVLQSALTEYLAREQAAGRIGRSAVYVRDLENGPIMSLNAGQEFVPASLLKLPLLLAYLKEAEEREGLLDEALSFEWVDKGDLEPYFPGERTIEPQTRYTVRELLELMIAESDNASYYVLLEYLQGLDPAGDIYLSTMRELGLIEPTATLDETLSARSYASIFRALYNASFLTPEHSELALEILAKSSFWAGLRGGVPDDIPIAHKFGERFGFEGESKQLHDCGVVYYPGNPYLVCVMIEGSDFMEMATVIRNVSDMVYEEIDSRRL